MNSRMLSESDWRGRAVQYAICQARDRFSSLRFHSRIWWVVERYELRQISTAMLGTGYMPVSLPILPFVPSTPELPGSRTSRSQTGPSFKILEVRG